MQLSFLPIERFTVGFVTSVHAKRLIDPYDGPEPVPLPSFNEGFDVVFAKICQLKNRYKVPSTPLVNLYISSYVDDHKAGLYSIFFISLGYFKTLRKSHFDTINY